VTTTGISGQRASAPTGKAGPLPTNQREPAGGVAPELANGKPERAALLQASPEADRAPTGTQWGPTLLIGSWVDDAMAPFSPSPALIIILLAPEWTVATDHY
jgi:hypothetical protein